MQCGIRKVRRQEVVEQRVKCFWCGKEGHKKWKCPEGKEKRREETVPPQEVWKKVKEYCRAKGLLPRGAAISMKGWMTKWEVVTLMECRGCNYKGTKTQEN